MCEVIRREGLERLSMTVACLENSCKLEGEIVGYIGNDASGAGGWIHFVLV